MQYLPGTQPACRDDRAVRHECEDSLRITVAMQLGSRERALTMMRFVMPETSADDACLYAPRERLSNVLSHIVVGDRLSRS